MTQHGLQGRLGLILGLAAAACPAPGARAPVAEPAAVDAAVASDGGEPPVADALPAEPDAAAQPADERVVAIDAGEAHTCALTADGRVFCWGALACPGADGRRIPDPAGLRPMSGLPAMASLGVRGDISCAVDRAGAVWCWGPVLPAPAACASEPQAAGLEFPVVALRIGERGGPPPSCAETADGEVLCFPFSALYPSDHVCGQGDWLCNPDRAEPIRVETGGVLPIVGPLRGVTVEEFVACAVAADATIWCWQQTGDEHAWRFEGTWQEEGLANVVAVEPYGPMVWALTGDGTLYVRSRPSGGAWGSRVVPGTEFVPVAGLDAVVRSFDAASGDPCVVTDDGRVLCRSREGEETVFVAIEGLAGPATAVTVGSRHACALLASGDVQCWGDNDHGQISADLSLFDSAVAVTVEGLGPAQ